MENNFKYLKQLCKACIKSKCTQIVKLKKMTLITKKLQKVHTNLWGFHEPAFILKKNYMALLLNKFIWKS